jgi:hypothetical protein
MASREQKKIFELPLKFIFTEKGSSALMHQKVRINRLKMGDKTDDYGVFLDKVTPGSLQRMLFSDYVSKLEISGVEPVENRAEIIDLSKLIIFSLLYGKYNYESLSRVLSADIVKKWNRGNPYSIIDGKTQFKEGFLKQYLAEHSEELKEIRGDLLNPLNDNISRKEDLLAEEKNQQILLAEKLLTFADPLIWFVLLKFHSGKDYLFLIRDVRLCLEEYMKKSVVAEYAAMMIIELACNIENLNLLREAQLFYNLKRIDMHQVLQDPKIRIPLIEELRKKNSLLTFSWKIGGADSSIGTRGRFQVILYDKEIHYREMRDCFEATKSADISRFDLPEFYKLLLKEGNDLDLGMYYLSYLNEACDNVGVKFEAMVNEVHHSGLTVTILSFAL